MLPFGLKVIWFIFSLSGEFSCLVLSHVVISVANFLCPGRLVELLDIPLVLRSSSSDKVGSGVVLHWKHAYAWDVLPW